jgi:multidrug efflux pump subunit AcrB
VQLERSRGVGEVTVVGGLERAINIWLDADRLAMFELPVTSVRDALLRQNSQVPGGNVTTPGVESSLRTLGRLTDPRRSTTSSSRRATARRSACATSAAPRTARRSSARSPASTTCRP